MRLPLFNRSWFSLVAIFSVAVALVPTSARAGSGPTAITGPFILQTTDSVRITGTVTPQGNNATAHFDYGPDTNYGQHTADFVVGAGTTPVGVTNLVAGLSPAQAGHYRLVAWDNSGTNFGADAVFSTAGTGGGGYAVSFDGVGQSLTSTIYFYFGYGTVSNAFTAEAWIKPNDLTSTDTSIILEQGANGGGANWSLQFFAHGTILHFSANDFSGSGGLNVAINPADFTDGNWHHLAATFNGAAEILYKDGVAIGSAPVSGELFAGATNFTVAGTGVYAQAPANVFNGVIDEVRLWSIARSRNEIVAGMNSKLSGAESGLIAYWAFDEGSGTVTYSGAPTPPHTDNRYYNYLELDPVYRGGVGPLWVVSTAPISPPPVSVSVVSLRNETFVADFSAISVAAATTSAGAGISSVSLTIQRWTDSAYWNGSSWGGFAALGTSLSNGRWSPANALPTGGNLSAGFYVIRASATDQFGHMNSASSSVTVGPAGIPAPATRLPGGNILLQWAGVPYVSYTIQASSDLINWQPIGSTYNDGSGILQFQDTGASGHSSRFYRTVR